MVQAVAPADGLEVDLAYQVTVLVRARAVLDRTRAAIAPASLGDADEDWPTGDGPGDVAVAYAAPGVM